MLIGLTCVFNEFLLWCIVKKIYKHKKNLNFFKLNAVGQHLFLQQIYLYKQNSISNVFKYCC